MSVRLVASLAARLRPADDADLVRRHGPMVAGVCRRLLGPGPDADDAAQAVWLVFLRRRHVVRDGGAGPFLYGVAVRTARHARSRRRRWSPLPDLPDTRPSADSELAGLIDTELSTLPAGMRAAVLLCEVEGRSLKDAAADLGVPVGTLASRLARGRQRLADRLKRRGVAVPAAALSGWLASHGTAAVPAGPASAAAVTLSRRVLNMLLFDKLRRVAVGLLLAGGLAAGGIGVGGGRPAPPPVPTAVAKPVPDAFAGLWSANPDQAVAAAFALADDPDQAVPYLAYRLRGCIPDLAQVDRWLADLGVGGPADLKAAADRRREATTKLGDRPPDDDSWPPLTAGRELRAVLWAPAVYARLAKLTTDLPPGPARLEVLRLLVRTNDYQQLDLALDLRPDTVVSFTGRLDTGITYAQDGEKSRLELPNIPLPLATNRAEVAAVGRAVFVLERIGNPAARAILAQLAAGPADQPPARVAQAALDRLGKR